MEDWWEVDNYNQATVQNPERTNKNKYMYVYTKKNPHISPCTNKQHQSMAQGWEKIFVIIYLIKGYLPKYIKKSNNPTSKTSINFIKISLRTLICISTNSFKTLFNHILRNVWVNQLEHNLDLYKYPLLLC